MPRLLLTDQFCRSATVQDGEKQTDYFDLRVRNLALRVSYTGRKVWTFRYWFNKEKRRMTLGPFGDRVGELRLLKAREEALRATLALKDHIDPGRAATLAKHRRLSLETNTVAHAIDRRIERLRADRKRESYLGEMKAAFDRHVVPAIGKLPISDVQPWEIQAMLKPLADKKKYATHNRILVMLSPVFKEEKVNPNPCEDIQLLTENTRSGQVFMPDELAAIWKALDHEDAGCSPAVIGAIRLGMLTLKRGQEVAGARIAEFNLDTAQWEIPGDRMKNGDEQIVPLSPQACEIIRNSIRDTPREKAISKDDVLFFSRSQTVPIGRSALSHAFARAKVVAGLQQHGGTLHCLRHSGVTYLGDNGAIAPHINSSLLSHRTPTLGTAKATSRYLKSTYFDYRKAALETWGEIMREALARKQEEG